MSHPSLNYMSDKTKAIIIRFIKGFIAGGIGSILPMLVVINPKDLIENPNIIVYNLFVSFFTGGLLAMQKLLSWQDAPPTTIDSLPDVPKQSPPPQM